MTWRWGGSESDFWLRETSPTSDSEFPLRPNLPFACLEGGPRSVLTSRSNTLSTTLSIPPNVVHTRSLRRCPHCIVVPRCSLFAPSLSLIHKHTTHSTQHTTHNTPHNTHTQQQVHFAQADVTQMGSLNPFTHVYSFDTGESPRE